MYIDLTHIIDEEMPVYPGTEKPVLDRTYNIKEYGFSETMIKMFSHTGTHIDSPSHMIENAKMLETYDIDYFIGQAYILDISEGVPSLKELERLKAEFDGINYIILKTNWSAKWGLKEYYEDFPVLSVEVTKYLLDLGIRGIGIDAISVDPVGSEAFENHMLIFDKECIIIENLTNLDKINSSRVEIMAMPLKLKDSDGISARVVAKIK